MKKYPGNWIPTKSIEEMSQTNYDVLIIGTGPGGGATLYRLCQQWKNQGAKRIGIIEKGDKLFHSHSLNIPTMNVDIARDQLLPDNSTTFEEILPEFPGARMVYALGGRSLFWNAVTPRPIQSELKKWPVDLDELNMYYNIAENTMHITTDYADGSQMQEILLDRLQQQDIYEAKDMPVAFDLQPSRRGEIHSNPWFSSINFMASALFDKPYDLALNAFASRILCEGNKVAGVEVISPDKKTHIIRAKNIVVSASTLETPRLLLNSRIPGPAIGRYLTDHVSIIAIGTINRNQFPGDIGNLSILKAETKESPYQIQILGPNQYFSYQQFEDKIYDENLVVVYAAFGMTESCPENRVYVNPNIRDKYGVPLFQVEYSYNNNDLQVVDKMTAGIVQTAEAMGVTLDTSTLVVRPPGSDMHESCTCRMGVDPATSATNPHGQIHGVQGLFIADNSVLPTLTAAGPVFSNVALAIRLADYIVSISG